MFLVTPMHGQPVSVSAFNREQPESQQRSCVTAGSGKGRLGVKKAGTRLTGGGRMAVREANSGNLYRGGSVADAAALGSSPPGHVALAPRSFISGTGFPPVPTKPVPSPKFIC